MRYVAQVQRFRGVAAVRFALISSRRRHGNWAFASSLSLVPYSFLARARVEGSSVNAAIDLTTSVRRCRASLLGVVRGVLVGSVDPLATARAVHGSFVGVPREKTERVSLSRTHAHTNTHTRAREGPPARARARARSRSRKREISADRAGGSAPPSHRSRRSH